VGEEIRVFAELIFVSPIQTDLSHSRITRVIKTRGRPKNTLQCCPTESLSTCFL